MTPEPTDPASAPRTRQDHLATGLDCHYAHPDRRPLRPHCQQTAVVAYGTIALCAICDQMRSAVGRTNPPRPLPGAELHHLIAAARALTQAEHDVAAAVRHARHARASWAQIGDALNITRQAAQQRWTRPDNSD
jgi:hypothetical protein